MIIDGNDGIATAAKGGTSFMTLSRDSNKMFYTNNSVTTIAMEAANSERIRQLKLTAKWSADNNEKKQAISQLINYGDMALPAIQEVLNITVYDDVKQACVEAIRSLGGAAQKKKQATDINARAINRTKTGRKAIGKNTKKKSRKGKKLAARA
jgi:hypothetical protein